MVTIMFFFPLWSETNMPRDCYSYSKIRNNCLVKVSIVLSSFSSPPTAVMPHGEFSGPAKALRSD